MRLLIYLLALISGFWAAEAARAEVGPASSVMQTSIVAAEALVSLDPASAGIPTPEGPPEQYVQALACTPLVDLASTPVSRNDIRHE